MIGCHELLIELIPNEDNKFLYKFEITCKTKFRAYLINNTSNYNMNLIKENNENNNNDNSIDNNTDIIYEILDEGKYTIEITLDSSEEISIYLKIQRYDNLEINSINDYEKNNIIYYKEMTFESIYNQMDFNFQFLKKFQKFIKNSKIKGILLEIPKDSIFYNENKYSGAKGVYNLQNFNFNFFNFEDGYIFNFASNFEYNPDNKQNIIYKNNNSDIYKGICSFGTFDLTENFVMKNFDDNFKNLLSKQGFNDNEIDLNRDYDISNKSYSSCCCNCCSCFCCSCCLTK